MEAVNKEEIVQAILPAHSIRADAADERVNTEECRLLTRKKLRETVLSMKDRKVPGPDGIPNKVLKLIRKFMPDLLLNAFNAS